jgi:hypothetical protein
MKTAYVIAVESLKVQRYIFVDAICCGLTFNGFIEQRMLAIKYV